MCFAVKFAGRGSGQAGREQSDRDEDDVTRGVQRGPVGGGERVGAGHCGRVWPSRGRLVELGAGHAGGVGGGAVDGIRGRQPRHI
eukprot:1175864-Prorocentrum_minimum.AAC.1